MVKGPSLSDLVKTKDPKLDVEMRAKLEATVQAMQAIRQRADTLETYDRMIADGNKEGNAVVQAAIDSLIDQTRSIERVIAVLGGVILKWTASIASINLTLYSSENIFNCCNDRAGACRCGCWCAT